MTAVSSSVSVASSTATGASFRPFTVTVAFAVAVPPLPSEISYDTVSASDSPTPRSRKAAPGSKASTPFAPSVAVPVRPAAEVTAKLVPAAWPSTEVTVSVSPSGSLSLASRSSATAVFSSVSPASSTAAGPALAAPPGTNFMAPMAPEPASLTSMRLTPSVPPRSTHWTPPSPVVGTVMVFSRAPSSPKSLIVPPHSSMSTISSAFNVEGSSNVAKIVPPLALSSGSRASPSSEMISRLPLRTSRSQSPPLATAASES